MSKPTINIIQGGQEFDALVNMHSEGKTKDILNLVAKALGNVTDNFVKVIKHDN